MNRNIKNKQTVLTIPLKLLIHKLTLTNSPVRRDNNQSYAQQPKKTQHYSNKETNTNKLNKNNVNRVQHNHYHKHRRALKYTQSPINKRWKKLNKCVKTKMIQK